MEARWSENYDFIEARRNWALWSLRLGVLVNWAIGVG
jgi:hypothetical protein